jgi:hypothetical protein
VKIEGVGEGLWPKSATLPDIAMHLSSYLHIAVGDDGAPGERFLPDAGRGRVHSRPHSPRKPARLCLL